MPGRPRSSNRCRPAPRCRIPNPSVAVGLRWALDPQEVFTGLDTVCAAAIRNLAAVAFRPSMSYRAKRMLDL